MALIQPLWSISKRGVAVDHEGMLKLRTQLESELVSINAALTALNGGQPLNVKSGPQMATFIYDTLGCPKIGSKTPGGAWKMDDTTLATIQLKAKDGAQRQAIKMVRAARERRDLLSKFCDIDLDSDGRMRCHYDPAKTDTSRLSSRKFYPTGNGANLQNVPRDTRVRAVFVPDRGYVFGYADLKSAESLVVAHITGDPEMLRLHSPEYMDGKRDGHKYVASFLLGKPIDQITKDDRYLGKRVRHAGNYGMSWHKLMQLINADAQTTGVSVDAAQAKSLINRYRQLHPYLQGWWNDVLQQLWQTHTVYTRHGRKRVFYDRPDAILPEAIAYDPQGTVAQTLNMGLLRLDKAYNSPENWMFNWDNQHLGEEETFRMATRSEMLQTTGFQMLLQVHDAVGFQVPEANADKAMSLLPELMRVPLPIKRKGIDPYQIDIPVEIQSGWNWGEFDEKKNINGLKTWKPAF
jgi:DNA polymerase-1